MKIAWQLSRSRGTDRSKRLLGPELSESVQSENGKK